MTGYSQFDEFVWKEYGYDKDDEGNIQFPDDRRTHRLSKMVKSVKHPAKNNLYMLEAISRYLNEQQLFPEDGHVILDPMAGAGSILAGAEYCTRMVMIELGPVFSEAIFSHIEELGLSHAVLMPETDCVAGMKKMHDGMINSTIFSPPYADQLQTLSGTKIYDDKTNTAGIGIRNYAYEHKRNMANMKRFFFTRVMREFYRELFRVTAEGGTVCIIIKDRMNKGERLPYGVEQARWAYQAGFKSREWHQRVAVGSIFGTWNLKQGIAQVTDEHIIMLRKPVL